MLTLENYTIDALNGKTNQEDYKYLKDLAIPYIQMLSKKTWTDYNAGDPGITTLELLCYALTDLGYRTELPLEDLLTQNGSNSPFNNDNSYEPRKILTHNPINVEDYRKIILDQFPEIRNVWIYPLKKTVQPEIYLHKNKKNLTLDEQESLKNEKITLNGLYNVKFETIHKGLNTELIPKLHYFLNEHRNLCEDFNCIEPVKFEFVTTCMDVDIDGSVKPEILTEEIYRKIYQYCSPPLKRYSFNEMLNKGYSVEEIFQGPDLDNGFFDPKELENFDKRSVLYVSDIINLLMDIPGIQNIRKIHLNSYESNTAGEDAVFDFEIYKDQEYCLHLSNPENVFRFFVNREDKKGNKINFYYRNLKLFEPILIPEENLLEKTVEIPKLEDEWPSTPSNHRDILSYYSIQNEFPKAYLLGKEGISDSENEGRKISRLQFKGFLLHFEQLMADYLAQLNHVKNLFSWNSDADYHSYMYQSLSHDEINDFEKIKSSGAKNYDVLFDTITNSPDNDNYHHEILGISPEENFDRRNRFLNHMIARFNDSFLEFSIVEFFKKNDTTYRKRSIIADKKSFLRSYPEISCNRLKAFNYKKEVWNTPNISGYELRVAKKLGLTNYISSNPDHIMRHSLAHAAVNLQNIEEPNFDTFYSYNKENFDLQFGFHLVEHVLLRPISKKDKLLPVCIDSEENILNCPCKDPYSFRITVVLPGWLRISLDKHFREYVEGVFREEIPAHIALKMCWVSPKKMFEFEKNYFLFMKYLEKRTEKKCETVPLIKTKYLAELITSLSDLENVYLPSHLVDCDEIDFDFMTNESSKYPTILNQTMLNSKLTFDVNWLPKELEPWDKNADYLNTMSFTTLESGIQFKINNVPIDLQDAHLLELQLEKGDEGQIAMAFSNGQKLFGFELGEKKYFPIKLINEDFMENSNEDFDLVWCAWSDKNLVFNINKKTNFNVEMAEIGAPGLEFNGKITDDGSSKMFKIKKTSKSAYYAPHDLEKFWLEKQFSPSYEIPGLEEVEIAKFMSVFISDIKKNKQKKTNKILNHGNHY